LDTAGFYIRAGSKASTKLFTGGVFTAATDPKCPFSKRLRLSESNLKEDKSNDKGALS